MTERVLLREARDADVPALVCIHGASGRVDDYRALAEALPWRGAIVGIAAPARDAYVLADLAVEYCAALDLARPVMLLGWSLGGVIAAELARVAVGQGAEVAFLGVIDSRAPQPEMRSRPADRDALARFFVFQRALVHECEPPARPATSDAATLLAALRACGAAGDLADERAVERELTVFMALIRALYHSTPQPVPVPLHLFEAADAHPSHPKPPTLGWEPLTPSLVRDVVPGTHFNVLAPHRAPALAATIARYLRNMDRRSAS